MDAERIMAEWIPASGEVPAHWALTPNGSNTLMWFLRLDNKAYGNAISIGSKVSRSTLALIKIDLEETLERLDLVEKLL